MFRQLHDDIILLHIHCKIYFSWWVAGDVITLMTRDDVLLHVPRITMTNDVTIITSPPPGLSYCLSHVSLHSILHLSHTKSKSFLLQMKLITTLLYYHTRPEQCWSFLDPKDLRNWLCHSIRHVTPSLMDVFQTENHCLGKGSFEKKKFRIFWTGRGVRTKFFQFLNLFFYMF